MSASTVSRLNQVLPKICSEDFLSCEGIGNEIACHIFDYPAGDELLVRDHIEMIRAHFKAKRPDLEVIHIDLLKVVLDYLEGRGLMERAMKLQADKGDSELVRVLDGALEEGKIRDFIAESFPIEGGSLVLMSGVGSVWPLIRAHTLLSCLHTVLGGTPLVMFYPGEFDGLSLNIFGQASSTESPDGRGPYYRAFRLIP